MRALPRIPHDALACVAAGDVGDSAKGRLLRSGAGLARGLRQRGRRERAVDQRNAADAVEEKIGQCIADALLVALEAGRYVKFSSRSR